MPSLVRPFAAAFLAALTVLPTSASAQELPVVPMVTVAHADGTGWVRNDGTERGVIATLVVREPGVGSLRIHFDEVHLAGSPFDGTGSVLRLTSLADGAMQTLDALGLQQWQGTSAWFNGDAVVVELVAAPRSGPNLVSTAALEVGVPASSYQSQCGTTDDRVPSNDPRVARLLPSGCTAWMIDDCAKCFLSAGHCGSDNTVVEFNVPFSTSAGGWNHPPPSDQYSIDPASKQISNVFGNDWFYFGTFPNSTTGLTAYEGQGDAFALVSPPPVAGTTIRITGHGVDETPDDTYNQIQQTHTGPFVSNGSELQYQVDTEGGNSGSPIIWEQANAAIGIHTNAGCTASGGANQGTPITVAALQAALAHPLGVCAQGGFGGPIADLGHGKIQFPPFGTPPAFSICASLQPNSPYELYLELPNMFAMTATAYFVLGLTEIDAPFKGGVLVPSPDVIVPVPVNTTVTDPSFSIPGTWPAGIPSQTAIYGHWWIAYTSTIFTGVIASNAISMTTP